MSTSTKETCFVLMPFDEQFNELYLKVYKSAIENADMICKRADDLNRPSSIIRDIWEFIVESKIIIADITGRNPNVMYELGLAHAIAKPTIIVSESIEDVPFDLRHLRIITYQTKHPNWGEELKERINKSILETKESPLISVLPTFLNIKQPDKPEFSDTKIDILEIKQLLYKQLEGKENIETIGRENYQKAFSDAHNLYFNAGQDEGFIREHIVEKYHITYHAASDIIRSIKNRWHL